MLDSLIFFISLSDFNFLSFLQDLIAMLCYKKSANDFCQGLLTLQPFQVYRFLSRCDPTEIRQQQFML